jgi:hypothetical protein
MSLGDISLYLQPISTLNWKIIFQSTALVKGIAGTANTYIGEYFAHFIFFSLSLLSFSHLLKVANLSKRYTIFLMLMFCTPSIGIWSSLVGKEAIMIFASCIFLSNMIRLYRGEIWNTWSFLLGFYLLFIFKPHIAPIFLFCALLILFNKLFKQKVFITLAYTIVCVLFLSVIFIQFYLIIDDISISLVKHFSSGARLTRENIYFINPGDIFKIRPDYWLTGFMGLKITEVENWIDFIFYIEGRLITFVVFILILYRSQITWTQARLSILYFVLTFSFCFWLLVSNYPMSILNPGSGMRYRSGILPALFVFLSVFPMVHGRPTKIV